ncbi:MAG TPA: DHA2 family efflux MFS transporter permease subunit [Solirubrobacterales bacterium]|jgi:DHA2 family methylenomycin A resistance protein-like MFS transporter
MTDSDTPRGRGPALAVASAGYFFVLLDVTIVNVALARIGSGLGLGGSRAELQWVVDAYALVLAAGMLGAGDLADRTGSRRLFLAGLMLFSGASALCAAAPDAGVLIGARAMQGLGAAAILPGSLAIVNQLFPDPEERPKAIGVWAGLGGSALVLGPILGGVLVGPLGWRAIFWLNVPLAIAALVGGFLTLPVGSKARGARPDWMGQMLGTAALAALVFALIESGKGGFASAPAFGGIAVAVVAFAGFLVAERRAPRPLLDLGWFRRAEFTGANAGAGLMNLGTLGGLFALGLFLQETEGLSPLEAGLALVPLALPLAALTPFTGRLVGRIGPRLPAGLGLAATGVGYLGAALVGGPAIDTPLGWAFLAIAGGGMGVAVPGLVAGATEALGPDRAGIASAVNNTSRQVGGAIGVALIGGLSSISTSLLSSAAALVLGGILALALMPSCRGLSSAS